MKSNFSSALLLCNGLVTIVDKNGHEYKMTLPVLKDKLEDLSFESFVGFCSIDLDEFNKQTNASFDSRLSLLKYYENNNAEIKKVLEKNLAKYMIGFQYVDDFLYWGNMVVSKEIFETFCNYIAIASGSKTFKDLSLVITEDMDEFEKQRISNEIRIAKIKRKGSNESSQQVDLDSILVGVSREFHYSYDQLYNMTLYSIYFMYSKLGEIMSYDINNIAAGNGLLKKGTKHNHWTIKSK